MPQPQKSLAFRTRHAAVKAGITGWSSLQKKFAYFHSLEERFTKEVDGVWWISSAAESGDSHRSQKPSAIKMGVEGKRKRLDWRDIARLMRGASRFGLLRASQLSGRGITMGKGNGFVVEFVPSHRKAVIVTPVSKPSA